MPLPDAGRAERAAWLRLSLTPGVGPASVRDLLSVFGLPEDVVAAGRPALSRVVGDRLADALSTRDELRDSAVERALEWAQAPDHHLLSLADPAYPARLLQIGDPPPLLYVAGDPALLNRPMLAIVGSRSATRGGLENAEAFAAALGEAGLTIASGLALGIDAAAHRGALATAAGTVAVFGTGADVAYPAANRGLADAIRRHGGAVVSELPLGTGPREANFPRRNRLIAGLSRGVLVVEAALRSGSLITARLAGEFGREVFAIPGSIHSPLSKGCHQLIKQGAKLVESAQDVLGELPGIGAGSGTGTGGTGATRAAARSSARASAQAPAPSPGPRSVGCTPDEGSGAPAEPSSSDPVLVALGWDPISAEALAGRLGGVQGAVGTLAEHLLALEIDGRIERLHDGRYQRLGRT